MDVTDAIHKSFSSLSPSELHPDAVLMLGSPSVTVYEQSVYLDLWRRYNHSNVSLPLCPLTSPGDPHSLAHPMPNSPKMKRPYFICADGGWKRLAKDHSYSSYRDDNAVNMERGSTHPQSQCLHFDIICGDFDSQGGSDGTDATTAIGGGGQSLPIPPCTDITHSKYTDNGFLVNNMRDSIAAHTTVIETSHIDELTTEQLQVLRDHFSGGNDINDASSVPIFSIKVSDQESSDFGKCVCLVKRLLGAPSSSSCKTNSELPVILVLGSFGGRFDHSMATMWVLLKERDDLRIILHDDSNTIIACPSRGITTFIRDPAIDAGTCGVMVFGASTDKVTTRGLKWDLGPSLGIATGFLSDCLSTSNEIEGITVVQERGRAVSVSQCHDSNNGDANDISRISVRDVKNKDHFGFVEIDTMGVANGGADSGVLFSVARK